MNGIEDACPANCPSIFSLVHILLAVSTTCLKFIKGKRTQYNFVGRVFLKLLISEVLSTLKVS